MEITFYLASAIAIAATAMVIVERRAVHALLYLIVSLLAVAVVFYLLGAPFVAALEVIIYAGAIMVLFVFVMMMLDLGRNEVERENSWLRSRAWAGPGVLAALLLAELIYMLAAGGVTPASGAGPVDSKTVGIALLGPYLLGVELASMLLLAALAGAWHIGRSEPRQFGHTEAQQSGQQETEGG